MVRACRFQRNIVRMEVLAEVLDPSNGSKRGIVRFALFLPYDNFNNDTSDSGIYSSHKS